MAISLSKPGGVLSFPQSSGLSSLAPRDGDPALGTTPARRAARLALGALAAAFALYIGITSVLVLCYRFVDPPATVLMAYRKWGFGWKIEAPRPKPLTSTPLYIRRMLLSVEDYKFYEHFGIDFEAFRNAHEINKRIGKPLYGGSTLTMQVARTLFLVPVKSYVRKGLEVIVALELEAFLPKDRILELYLGYAEWGKGIFGIESAAKKWYGVGSRSLSREQAARLVALLSSPVKYRPETLQRNGILRERYRFLVRRYVTPAVSAAQSAPAEPQAESPKEALEVAPPPPSPEPGTDLAPDQGDAEQSGGAERGADAAAAADALASPAAGAATPTAAAPAP